MKIKKVLALVMTAAMVFAFAACGGSAPANNTSSDAADSGSLTLKDGVLQVGMEIGYPPMEYFDTDGTTPIGFDVELSKAIAEYLGMEVEYVDVAWDGIFAGLDSDKYDMVCSSCSIIPERQQNYLMSKPYVQNRIELLVPADSDITGLDNLSGKSIGVQAETTADIYLQDHDTGCDIMQYDKIINCFDELKSGRVDGVLVDSVVAAYYLGEDESKYNVVWEGEDAEPLGITFKKGNDPLCEKVEEALDALAADGTTAKIAEKYFGSDITEGIR